MEYTTKNPPDGSFGKLVSKTLLNEVQHTNLANFNVLEGSPGMIVSNSSVTVEKLISFPLSAVVWNNNDSDDEPM
jgi:hypothetical protein